MISLPSRRSPLSRALAPHRLVPAVFISIAALLAAQPAAAVQEGMENLPENTDGIWHQAVSGNGTVVGIMATPSGNQFFSWSASQGISQLGAFATSGTITGVSLDASYITGNASLVPGSNNQRAYRWHASTGFTDLGTLGGATSYGAGISNDGSVIVGRADLAGGAGHRAFRWEAGVMQYIGTLYGQSQANAVSGDGKIVVGYSNAQAFRWEADTGMVALAAPGNSTSNARAISNDGVVIVGDGVDGTGYRTAVFWTQAGGMERLGTLGGNTSRADDVSADGSVIVGSSAQADGNVHAYRWTQANGMVSLGVLTGQTTSAATDVTHDGNTVIGTSGNRFFIWTPQINNPGSPDGILQDLIYLQTSVMQSADTVNHLISTQKRRLRDSAQQQCLPGALQTLCLSAGATGYRSEADTDGNQRNVELAAGLRLSERYSIGANLSAGRADIREQSAEQRKAFALGLWAAYQENADQQGWGASVSASGGQSNNYLKRGTGLLDVQRAQVEMDMSGAALRLAANYGMQMGKALVTPELALTHVRTRQDGFTERNVAFPLTIGATDTQETLATLGVNIATPVTPKGTVHVSLAVDALLHEDTLPLEGRSAVPGFSHFQLDSSLNKRRLLPSASAGYSHALTANSSIGGNVQVSSSVYKGAQPVSGAGVQYRYAF